jgi:hypothetical protein
MQTAFAAETNDCTDDVVDVVDVVFFDESEPPHADTASAKRTITGTRRTARGYSRRR